MIKYMKNKLMIACLCTVFFIAGLMYFDPGRKKTIRVGFYVGSSWNVPEGNSYHIIQEIIIEENEVRYDVVTDNHGHFKCKSCGEIIDFDVNLSKFDLSKLGNVEIDEIHFYIKGTCEKCLEKKN